MKISKIVDNFEVRNKTKGVEGVAIEEGDIRIVVYPSWVMTSFIVCKHNGFDHSGSYVCQEFKCPKCGRIIPENIQHLARFINPNGMLVPKKVSTKEALSEYQNVASKRP